NDLLRKLELATAPASEGNRSEAKASEFDPRTGELRDAWLAFGRLLESANSSGKPIEFPAAPMQPSRSRRWLFAVSFVAAASLAAVLVVVGLRSNGTQQNQGPSLAATPAKSSPTVTPQPDVLASQSSQPKSQQPKAADVASSVVPSKSAKKTVSAE